MFNELFEATASDLKRKQKSITRLFPNFPDRVKGVADNGGIRLESVEDELWKFKIHSGTKKDVWYDAYLYFKDIIPTLVKVIKDRRLWVGDKSRIDRRKLARKFMDVADIQVKCSCPAFQYWGPAYILSLGRYDAKYTNRELRPPNVRNKKQYGAYCKHIENLMKVLPFYNDTAMKWLEDFYEEDIKAFEKETQKEYGWLKAAAKELGKKKEGSDVKEPEEEEEQEGKETKESVQEVYKLGSCMLWAENKVKQLLNKGISDFIVVEGYVFFGDDEENRVEHTWVELSDETKLDDTIDQFEHWGFSRESVDYLPYDRKEYSPQGYLDLCGKYPEETKESIEEDKRYSEVVPESDIPEYLYHATYIPLMKKISLEGLKPGAGRSYSFSESGVYFDRTREGAEGFAECAEEVPDKWLDNIVVLKVASKNLDKNKLEYDPNVIVDEGEEPQSFIYKGSIPASMLEEIKESISEKRIDFYVEDFLYKWQEEGLLPSDLTSAVIEYWKDWNPSWLRGKITFLRHLKDRIPDHTDEIEGLEEDVIKYSKNPEQYK